MYWELIGRNGDKLEGLRNQRVHRRKGKLGLPQGSAESQRDGEKESEDRFLFVSATGLGVRQRIGNREQNAQ